MKVIYIHGFNSAGFGDKVNKLKSAFGEENVISINLPYDPDKAIKLLSYLVERLKDDDLYLFGTSLGGFYAMYLAIRYKVPAVLINPSINPYESLKEEVGKQINYKTDEEYEFTEEHLNTLKDLQPTKEEIIKAKDFIFVYLDEDDELLDSRETAEFFKGFYVKMYPGGNHRFQHMEELIEDFRKDIMKEGTYGKR